MPGAADSTAMARWLKPDRSGNGTYRHLLLVERERSRADGIVALHDVVEDAYRDAKQRIDRLTGISLDPLGGEPPDAPTLDYPDGLHTYTLQGHLGEIAAGLVAEIFEPHGRRWTVPAYLFRFHTAAQQMLERRRQLGGPARHVPGRTGDDCLAFVRDDDGRVVAWLMCEAKCSHDHNAGMIAAGHAQLSDGASLPIDLLQLVDVLADAGDDESREWASALRLLYAEGADAARSDMLVYVYGRGPKQRATWIDTTTAHASYTATRPLEAVELHLSAFDEVLAGAYPAHVIDRG
jgi:hypothetical protein